MRSRPHRPIARPRSLPAGLPMLLIMCVLLATSCDPVSRDWHWTLGRTHGAIIETTAGRASLGVYREPTRILFKIYDVAGLEVVQDQLWKYGRPPSLRVTVAYRGRSVTVTFGTATSAARSLAREAIFERSRDLEGAIIDSHASDSCLALTLISYGSPGFNWTTKNVGCRTGSLPVG